MQKVNKSWELQTPERCQKQSHKKRSSLLSSIKFNFWGHAAVSHYSNVARMVSQLEGDAVEISLRRTHILEKMLALAQIKRPLPNCNRLVRIFSVEMYKSRREGEGWLTVPP